MTTNEQPMDHIPPEEFSAGSANQSDMEKNVKSRSTWMRLLFMLIVALLYGVSRIVLGVVVITQFFFVLLTGEIKEELKTLGKSLAVYSYQVVQYLSFNTEEKPFPFDAPWPDSLPPD